MEFEHIPVLLRETMDSLNIRPDGVYVDGTLGGAGHSYHICERLGDQGKLIGIDQDEEAVAAAATRLKAFSDKVTIVRGNYADMRKILSEFGIGGVDGILLDIGVSSHQLDDAARGFTYREEDAPLDMRMDNRSTLTAEIVVNEYSESELFRIIRDYGEDPFAKNIAKHIVRMRSAQRICTAGQLVEAVKAAIPMKCRAVGGHPAKQTFQAIRIEVNKELEVLQNSIDDMIDLLNDKGRLSIITFHSLEDRIVKTQFKKNVDVCTCPPNFPVCVCKNVPKGRIITRKSIMPSEEEVLANKRARSARLRVFERRREEE